MTSPGCLAQPSLPTHLPGRALEHDRGGVPLPVAYGAGDPMAVAFGALCGPGSA